MNHTQEMPLPHVVMTEQQLRSEVQNHKTLLGRIFWGLLLVLLDFRINGFDLLPDILGYAFLFSACGGLRPSSPAFGVARGLALLGAVFWFFSFVVRDADSGFGLFWSVQTVALVWYVFGGLNQYCYQYRLPHLARVAHGRRVIYTASLIATMFFAYAGAGELAVVIGLGSIVVAVMLLMLVRQIIGQIANGVLDRQDAVEASLGY